MVERLGYSEAKRLSVTGARFGVAEAYRIGLARKVWIMTWPSKIALAATARGEQVKGAARAE
jgi:isohexenylglutaconyl-CoA hydratase